MATLIPSDVLTSSRIDTLDCEVARQLQQAGSGEWVWYNPAPSGRPRFILLGPGTGLVGIDVCDLDPAAVSLAEFGGVKLANGATLDPLGELGPRLTDLDLRLQALQPRPAVNGRVALPRCSRAEFKRLNLDGYFLPDSVLCADDPPPNGAACTPAAVAAIRERLYPETQIVRSLVPTDSQADANAARRIALDGEQEDLARSIGSGLTFLTGVAGSGKSLVLAARARYLAARHPDWKVLLLCFNRTLVGYLEDLVGPEAAGVVEVKTFAGWTHQLGIRLPRFGEEGYERRCREILNAALATLRPAYDAVLVDEAQDFHPCWLVFTSTMTRSKRGGLMLACDPDQAVYSTKGLRGVTAGPVREVHLKRNYRNTEAVLRVASAAALERTELTEKPALAGAPVQLVWAESWDEQADFIGRCIGWLLAHEGASRRDIAVLFPKRSSTLSRIRAVLAHRGIDFVEVSRDRTSKREFELRDERVKVMTVHSAKGLEFRYVFVFGMEALTEREQADQQRHLAYVAMTRAQDALYLTYTRPNPMLDRALALARTTAGRGWCECRTYPDDFDWGA